MAFEFKNLDAKTRQIMLDEFENDCQSGHWYKSPRLSPIGIEKYPELVKESFKFGTEETLVSSIKAGYHLNAKEMSHRNGNPYEKAVARNANQILGEGEFNRYYMIALCKRAQEENKQIRVYRARASSFTRDESEALIGHFLNAESTLNLLKDINNRDNHLPQPNSGITLELV